MPGARVEQQDDKTIITMSQSWLGTYLECGEQARRDLYEPEDGTNEQHLVGTTLHAYAQCRLTGESVAYSHDHARDVMADEWHNVRKVRWQKVETCWGYAKAAFEKWEEEVFPYADPMLVEYTMSGLVHCEPGLEVWLEGTPDHVDHSGDIDDWKTASDPWDELATERWNLQSSAYTWLTEVNGFEPSGWFRFWVYVKGSGYTQSIRIFRGHEHWEWLKRQAIQAARMVQADLPQWTLNDQSWLCSPKWCPYYSSCKGALGTFPTTPAILVSGGETTTSESEEENA